MVRGTINPSLSDVGNHWSLFHSIAEQENMAVPGDVDSEAPCASVSPELKQFILCSSTNCVQFWDCNFTSLLLLCLELPAPIKLHWVSADRELMPQFPPSDGN